MCGKDIDCDGPFVVDDVAAPYASLSEQFPAFSYPVVEIANETIAALALAAEEEVTQLNATSGSGMEISISVGEITSWINAGGSNPLEAGLIRKILTFLNSAGISIQAGSLIYQFNNGPDTQLAGGCSPVHLQGGWNAHANLKPGFRITLTFGVNDMTLVVGSQVHSDCDFGMGGRIQAKFGKKIFGKCIRLLSKTESINIGAYMVMNVISRLELRPTFNIDSQLNVLIGLQPLYQIRGDLIKFEPNGKISIKIFGIHIGFIENAIAKGIREGIKKAFNQRTVDAQFAAATTAVQNALNNALKNAIFKIPLLPQQYVPKVQSAVNNIRNKQAVNM